MVEAVVVAACPVVAVDTLLVLLKESSPDTPAVVSPVGLLVPVRSAGLVDEEIVVTEVAL